MSISEIMFFMKNFVDNIFSNGNYDIDSVCADFERKIMNFSDKDFCNLLLFSGFIPDTYKNDSSEETLYTKLTEIVVCVWAKKLTIESNYVKQKASYEDINMSINNKTVVCDAKSFRLGRSQKAPNVKDFLKLEDIRKWLSRYKNQLGGLVVYPDTHEWTSGSDAYQYCSTKNAPTLMLPYKYLALILHYKDKFNVSSLEELWKYSILFPSALLKKNNNKEKYWHKINSTLLSILNIEKCDFDSYMDSCDKLIRICIKTNIYILTSAKKKIIETIKNEIRSKNYEELREMYLKEKINMETEQLDITISRIKEFRL